MASARKTVVTAFASAIATTLLMPMAASAASVGDTIVWRNSGTAGTEASHAKGNVKMDLCLPAMDGIPAGSSVKITSISFGSRHNTFTPYSSGYGSDVMLIRIYLSDTDFYTSGNVNGTGAASGKEISAHGTYVPRMTYSFGGVPVVVGATNEIRFFSKTMSADAPGLKLVKTFDTSSAVGPRDSSLINAGWYPVYEITATITSLGAACDTTATVSGDSSLSGLSWSAAPTTDGTQWAVLDVTDDAALTLDTATNFKLLTIKVASGKTLSLTGANPLTASKIDISGQGTVAIASAASLSGDIVGGGSVAITTTPLKASTAAPAFGYDWCGTVQMNGIDIEGPNFNSYGNVASKVRLSGVSGWVNTVDASSTAHEYVVPVVLEDGDYDFALTVNNGNSPQNNDTNKNRCSIFRKVLGNGSIVDGIKANSKSAWPVFKIYDACDFAGSITLERAILLICDASTAYEPSLLGAFYDNNNDNGQIRVEMNKMATLANGKTWKAKKITSYGNLSDGGTLDGDGYVLFDGKLPSGTYTNDVWTGTLALKNIADASPFNLHLLGNTNSTLALTSVGTNSAYLAGNVTANARIALTDENDMPALALNNGLSGEATIFRELSGSGTLTQSHNTTQGLTINVMTNFTGTLDLYKMTVTFGTATRHRDTNGGDDAGKVFIDQDAQLSVPAPFSLWAPIAVKLNGPVNFTTDAIDNDGLVLFSNVGSDFEMQDDAVIKVNGNAIDMACYSLKVSGGRVFLKEKRGHAIILR